MSTRNTILQSCRLWRPLHRGGAGRHRLRRRRPSRRLRVAPAAPSHVLVEAGGHAELTGVAETVQGRDRHRRHLRRTSLRRPVQPALQRVLLRQRLLRRRRPGLRLAAELQRRCPADRRTLHRRGQEGHLPRPREGSPGGRALHRHAGLDQRRNHPLPQGPVRGRQEQGRLQGQVRLRPGRPHHLEAVPGHLRVLHQGRHVRHRRQGRAWRPNGWPTSSRPAPRWSSTPTTTSSSTTPRTRKPSTSTSAWSSPPRPARRRWTGQPRRTCSTRARRP